MALSGDARIDGILKGGARLIVLLRRNETFFKEGIEAVKTLFREFRLSRSTLVLRLGAFELFGPHTLVHEARLGIGSSALRFDLSELSGNFRNFNLKKDGIADNRVAFANIDFGNAPRNLGRNIDDTRLHLPLKRRKRRMSRLPKAIQDQGNGQNESRNKKGL